MNFKPMQAYALANPLAYADKVSLEYFRQLPAGWTVGLSVNK